MVLARYSARPPADSGVCPPRQLVQETRIELATPWLEARCSTLELLLRKELAGPVEGSSPLYTSATGIQPTDNEPGGRFARHPFSPSPGDVRYRRPGLRFVAPERFELPALWFVAIRSIQLS